jgi:agmatinase
MMKPGEKIDSLKSLRFSQVTTFACVPKIQMLKGVKAAFLGIPFDDGTKFRTGPEFGPGIRQGIDIGLALKEIPPE